MDLRSAYVAVESIKSPSPYGDLIIQEKGTASIFEGLYLFSWGLFQWPRSFRTVFCGRLHVDRHSQVEGTLHNLQQNRSYAPLACAARLPLYLPTYTAVCT